MPPKKQAPTDESSAPSSKRARKPAAPPAAASADEEPTVRRSTRAKAPPERLEVGRTDHPIEKALSKLKVENLPRIDCPVYLGTVTFTLSGSLADQIKAKPGYVALAWGYSQVCVSRYVDDAEPQPFARSYCYYSTFGKKVPAEQVIQGQLKQSNSIGIVLSQSQVIYRLSNSIQRSEVEVTARLIPKKGEEPELELSIWLEPRAFGVTPRDGFVDSAKGNRYNYAGYLLSAIASHPTGEHVVQGEDLSYFSSVPSAYNSASAARPYIEKAGGSPVDLDHLFAAITPPDDMPEIAQPPHLRCAMLPFQRKAVRWMISKEIATGPDASKLHPLWTTFYTLPPQPTPLLLPEGFDATRIYANESCGAISMYRFPSPGENCLGASRPCLILLQGVNRAAAWLRRWALARRLRSSRLCCRTRAPRPTAAHLPIARAAARS